MTIKITYNNIAGSMEEIRNNKNYATISKLDDDDNILEEIKVSPVQLVPSFITCSNPVAILNTPIRSRGVIPWDVTHAESAT